MTRTYLESPSIGHHWLKGVRCICTSKFLTLRFFPSNSINRKKFTNRLHIHFEVDIQSKFFSIISCFMKCMPFLPMKFSGPKKGASSFFPAKDIDPLIIKKWKIPIWLEFIFEKITKKKLRGRTDGKWFFQFFPTTDRNYRKFWRKSFNMFFFSLKKTHRNKHW